VAGVAAGRRRSPWKLVHVRSLQEVDLAEADGRARPRWSPGSIDDGDDHGLTQKKWKAG
jgi:hypothetical protein